MSRIRAISASAALSGALVLAACGGSDETALNAQTAERQTALAPAAPAATVANAAPAAEPTVAAPAATVAEASTSMARPAPAAEPVRTAAAAPAGRASAPRPRPTPRPATAGGPSAAADEAPVRRGEPAAPFIAEGTVIDATVEEELDTERSKEGDRFHARLAEDLLGANGEVLLAAGSLLNGRIATSHASTGPNDLAALEVEIESITADGRTLPLRADVVEIQMEAQARDSNSKTAAKVGAGVAAGAIIGRILGSDKGDAAKGAAVGAAAGAAVAASQRSGHAVIKPGARMVIRLTERLIVSR